MPKRATSFNYEHPAPIRALEDKLGVPNPSDEFYEQRRKDWYQWQKDVWFSHAWFFDQSQCNNCQKTTAVVTAGGKNLCLRCMSTGVPWWPTGWVQPKVQTLSQHAQTCTSPSWSRMSESLTQSAKVSLSSAPHYGKALFNYMSSIKTPERPAKTPSTN